MSLSLPRLLSWFVPGLLWLWLFFHLHYEWTLNAQYNYGWAVPFLAIFLAYLRWPDRPTARPSPQRGWMVAGWVLLASLLPLRVIEEANPDWRLLSWALALTVVIYSLSWLGRIGSSGWVRHFAFPVCFPLVAVPWPVQLENAVVQNMTRAVAFAAVEIAGWIGVGAFQLGNVIELHNGFVGVDEACSGVKTLQAAIMVALALGELLRLGTGRRLGLLAAGCLWVFLCNVLRATFLVIIAAKEGTAALERWHDSIGTAVLVIGMAGLLGIGWLLRSQEEDRRAETAPTASAGLLKRIPMTGSLAAVGWLAVIFAATEVWYRIHETHLVQLPTWQVQWRTEREWIEPLEIPEATRAILHYNDASSAAWEDPAGVRWWSFFARWNPQRAALQLVRSHTPEICLPAVGRTFRRELPAVVVGTVAVPLRFRAYEFEQNGRPLFVYVCIQEDKLSSLTNPTQPAEWSARGRILAAMNGRRNLGQRLLELAVIGFNDFDQANAALIETARRVVVQNAPTG